MTPAVDLAAVPVRRRHLAVTPRLAEVLARPITPTLEYEIWRESPAGACIACWRDLVRLLGDEKGGLYCSRADGGSRPCQQVQRAIRRNVERAQELAKARAE